MCTVGTKKILARVEAVSLLEVLRENGVDFMQIPPGTLSDLQPCDIEISRQWKYLAQRITMQAHYDQKIRQVTSRDGILNM